MLMGVRENIGDLHCGVWSSGGFDSVDDFTPDDLNAWTNRQEPPQAIGISRETHVQDLTPGEASNVQISLTYSDGFGREIQSKLKVESGPAWVRQSDDSYAEEQVDERWLSSGRTVFNNKEKPVKQYEPFYTSAPDYEPEEFFAEYGVTPIIHYDPLLRAIRTDTPKGFFSKVEFTPWEVHTFDTNDTILDSDYYAQYSTLPADEQAALDKAAVHSDTPQIAHLDTIGRQFLTESVLESGNYSNALTTHTKFDITSKPLTVTDPRGNTAFTYT